MVRTASALFFLVVMVTASTASPRLFIGGSEDGITYSARETFYQKGADGVVTFTTHVVLSSKGSNSGAVTIRTGVPFLSADTTYVALSCYIDKTNGTPVIQAYLDPGSDRVVMRKIAAGGTTGLIDPDITGAFEVVVSGSYLAGDTAITFSDAHARPWYEFAETADGSILVSYNTSSGVGIRKNTNGGQGGPEAWELITTLPYTAYEGSSENRIYNPMSKLSNGNLAIVVGNGEMTDPTALGWIEISDNGETFGSLNSITIPSGAYWYGPLTELDDGSLVLSSHRIYTNNSESWLSIATDGANWNSHIQLPTPSDGNLGLTEAAVTDLANGDVLVAIRADDRGTGGFDGGYTVTGSDLSNLGTPASMGDVIRMPRFRSGYLAYRHYTGGTQEPTLRTVSSSGTLGNAVDVGPQANNAPFTFEVGGDDFVLYQQYPDSETFRLRAIMS